MITITQTDEMLLAEALQHFGLERAQVERHSPQVYSVTDGLVTIQTAAGPLKYRAGDGDLLTCAEGHQYFRWAADCMQCLQKRKHSLDHAVSYAARQALAKIQGRLGQRKQRVESAKSGGTPGSRKATWGERGVNW